MTDSNSTPTPCPFPKDTPNILKLDNSWTQKLPSGELISSSGVGTGGWAINPNVQNQCKDGGYCPYACTTGFIETQYDNGSSCPYVWEVKTGNGKIKYIGGGNRYLNIDNKVIRSGGNQGLYCNNGKLRFSNQVAEYTNVACVATPRVLNVKNSSANTITFCRSTNTFGIPQIPTVISPGESVFLTTIPTCKDAKWSKQNASETCSRYNYLKSGGNPVWWNGDADRSKPANVTYFLSRGNETDLNPVCQVNSVRPSTNKESSRGVDYYPYVLTIDADFKVKLNSNNDLLLGTCSGYDTYLGNPKYGVRLYDRDSIMIGQVEYSGNSANCYSYIIDKGQVHYDCKALRKGLSTSTNGSYAPITIELYDVPDTPMVTMPNVYCKESVCDQTASRNARYVKRATVPRADVVATTTTTTKTGMPTSTKIIIAVLVIVIIIVIIVLVFLLIRYYLKIKKANKEIKEQYQTQQVRNIGITPITSAYGVVLDPEDVPAVMDLTTFGNRPAMVSY